MVRGTATAILISLITYVLVMFFFTAFQATNQEFAFKQFRPEVGIGHPYFSKDAYLGWRLIPNFTYLAEKNEPYFETNRFGFRGKLEEPTQGGTVLLGDSFVQGYYLKENETISSQLSIKTNQPVFNLGVGGYSTDQEYRLVTPSLQFFKPKHVVLFFFINDLPFLDQNSAWGYEKPVHSIRNGTVLFDRKAPDIFKESLVNRYGDLHEKAPAQMQVFLAGFLENFQLPYHFFFPKFKKRAYQLEGLVREDYPWQSYTQEEILEPLWNTAFQFLEKATNEAKQYGADFTVFFIPELAQILADNPERFIPQKIFLNKCNQRKISCVEPSAEYLAKQKSSDLYFRDDGHFSPAGANLAAEILAKHL